MCHTTLFSPTSGRQPLFNLISSDQEHIDIYLLPTCTHARFAGETACTALDEARIKSPYNLTFDVVCHRWPSAPHFDFYFDLDLDPTNSTSSSLQIECSALYIPSYLACVCVWYLRTTTLHDGSTKYVTARLISRLNPKFEMDCGGPQPGVQAAKCISGF